MLCFNCKHFNSENDKCNRFKKSVTSTSFCSLWEEKDIGSEQFIEFNIKRKIVNLEPGDLNISNYYKNVQYFRLKQPFFYDRKNIFWFWNLKEYKWEIVDEIDLIKQINDILKFNGLPVSNTLKTSYLNAFKIVGRDDMPQDSLPEWIQFKDKVYNVITGKIKRASSNYFICNPIPWEVGKSTNTPTIDKLFKEWVGDEYVQTLYEIISYCCIASLPIHVAFCLMGNGMNGKSQFQKIVHKFIGKENVCSTELDYLMSNKFETFKLYKKLVCQMGETNFSSMSKTSMFKKLVGGDLIGFEAKNKMPFDDFNYATLIINSNSLPPTEDTSDGFFRRWVIIDFPNDFGKFEGKDVVNTIPDWEYNNLAAKCLIILPKLLELGKFTNQGSIEERKKRYQLASNPLPLFIEHFCKRDPDAYIKFSDFSNYYTRFLIKIKRRVVDRKELKNGLLMEGIEVRRTSKTIDDFNNRYDRDTFVETISVDIDKLDSLDTLSILSILSKKK